MIRNVLKLLIFSLLAACSLHTEDKVLVSVAPYVHIVERIAGDGVQVELLVPQAASPHTYEPTPKQSLSISSCKVWFCIGEPIEDKVRPALLSQNKNLFICDLHKGLDLIYEGHHCHHDHDHDEHSHSFDPHIWMSPKLMMKQVQVISEYLQKAFPERKEQITQNAKALLNDLQLLDSDIEKLFQGKNDLTVFVAHPAYGYFCREFGVKQISIEMEGKDPTAKELTALLDTARKLKVKKIFVQNQYSHKGAELIAKALGAKIVILDPYSEDYFAMMERVGFEFANVDN